MVRKDLFYANEAPKISQNIQQGENEPHKAAKRKGLKDISNRTAKIVKSDAKEEKIDFITLGIQKENQADMRISNNLKDACKTNCRICQKPFFITSLRHHTRNVHKVSINEYKKSFGEPKNNLIQKVYHKCGLCFKIILFDSDEISSHLKGQHKISHKDYNQNYMKVRESQKIYKRDEKAFKEAIDIQVKDNTIEKEKNKQQSSSSPISKNISFEKMSFEELFNEFDLALGSSVSSISKTKHEEKTTGELLNELELVLKSMS